MLLLGNQTRLSGRAGIYRVKRRTKLSISLRTHATVFQAEIAVNSQSTLHEKVCETRHK